MSVIPLALTVIHTLLALGSLVTALASLDDNDFPLTGFFIVVAWVFAVTALVLAQGAL